MMILENIWKKIIFLCVLVGIWHNDCNQFYGFAEVISLLFEEIFQSRKKENILGFKQVNA